MIQHSNMKPMQSPPTPRKTGVEIKVPSFEPTRDVRGNSTAKCTCNECGRSTNIKSAYATRANSARGPEVNMTQVIPKLHTAGWTYIKGVLRCFDCEAKRLETLQPLEKPMAKEPTIIVVPPPAPPLRQPSRDQKRLIVAALEDAYDTKNQRYKGTETDKSIADMLEDGIMSGWVAAVREDMFGPDGNEEMGSLAADVKAWMKKADDCIAGMALIAIDMETARAEVKKYQDRLNKIVAAIGPKAEKL